MEVTAVVMVLLQRKIIFGAQDTGTSNHSFTEGSSITNHMYLLR